MINLNESVAPEPVNVNDLAGIIRQDLIAAFALDIGYQTCLANVECNDSSITGTQDELISVIRNRAWATFKDWAKDEGYFYNNDRALYALDELFEAVRSATNVLSPAYGVWMDKYEQDEYPFQAYVSDTTEAMRDGDFSQIVNAWNQLTK